MSFETPPSEREDKQEERSRSIFERIYKSKISRVMALSGSLGFLGQFGVLAEGRGAERQDQAEAAVEVIDFGESGKDLNVFETVEGEKYIISFGQVHSDIQMDSTKKGLARFSKDGIKSLIDNQKAIEGALDILEKEHGVKDVYLEDTPSSWGVEMLKEAREEIHEADSAGGRLAVIGEVYAVSYASAEKMPDCIRGPLLYLLKSELSALNKSDLKPEEVEVADALLRSLGENPLIQGDSVYVWGGVMKKFAEGEVNIKIADDNKGASTLWGIEAEIAEEESGSLRERLESARIKAETIAEQEEFMTNMALGNNFREDVALRMIAEDAEKNTQKFYPIVYGVAHEFADNVKNYNEGNGTNFGLINVYQKAEVK